MSYVSISSVRGERRIKLYKAGENALLNAIDVLETIEDNQSDQSPLGGSGGPIEQAVMAIKATISAYRANVAPKKRAADAPGQQMLFDVVVEPTDASEIHNATAVTKTWLGQKS